MGTQINGSTIIFDSGHSLNVQNTQESVIDGLKAAGLGKIEFAYFDPWWKIDDEDQVAVVVDRVVAVREIREL